MRTLDRVPAHLRELVVEQDYGAYDEIDQAVWRFILLQAYARLRETAHPAYERGLERTGISVERIPSIAEMDEKLGAFGWGAVAVDGFIPPRAFQEFQAARILTIAAAIRRPEHLAYTPAPDIVHESAGHAPIVPDPEYAAFLCRFGEIGARAFSSPGDRRLHRVVHGLSDLKEDPTSSAEQLAVAERALAEAQTALGAPSEAALLSRLHWWTVEYGLVGTPRAYRLYGAGLLSSLGESHFCHAPSVRKLPLTVSCIDVDYDITKPQPQLFVAESFAQLGAVLEELAARLAQRRGGAHALACMRESEELGTLELDGGLQATGVLERVEGDGDVPAWIELTGPCALACGGRLLDGHGPAAHPGRLWLPLGPLEGDQDLARTAEAARPGDALELRYRSGVRVSGRMLALRRAPSPRDGAGDPGQSRDGAGDPGRSREGAGDPGRARGHPGPGRLLLLELDSARAWRGERPLASGPRLDLPLGARVLAAHAGPADPAYHAETRFPRTRAPRRRERPAAEGELLALYRRALRLWQKPESPALLPGFEEIHEALRTCFPEDWLLGWNLLECLRKLDRGPALAADLRAHLLSIERRHPDDAPISTGLRYLDSRYPG